jgi:ABC-2 type transport system ATP-binding protein
LASMEGSSRWAIETEGLHKSYKYVKALGGIDLRVERGTVLGLLGPNGAGKTTAVRILTTLLPPSAGSARVDGLDVVTQASQLRSRIGLAGQYAAVDENLTGRENLVMFGRLYQLPKDEAQRRSGELLGTDGAKIEVERRSVTFDADPDDWSDFVARSLEPFVQDDGDGLREELRGLEPRQDYVVAVVRL